MNKSSPSSIRTYHLPRPSRPQGGQLTHALSFCPTRFLALNACFAARLHSRRRSAARSSLRSCLVPCPLSARRSHRPKPKRPHHLRPPPPSNQPRVRRSHQRRHEQFLATMPCSANRSWLLETVCCGLLDTHSRANLEANSYTDFYRDRSAYYSERARDDCTLFRLRRR